MLNVFMIKINQVSNSRLCWVNHNSICFFCQQLKYMLSFFVTKITVYALVDGTNYTNFFGSTNGLTSEQNNNFYYQCIIFILCL